MPELNLTIPAELDGQTVRQAAMKGLGMSNGLFKRAKMHGQILLAREYLMMGVEPGWQPKDKIEELNFVAEHGKAVSRLLAYTVCRGYLSRHFLFGPTAWCLRNFVEWRYLMAAFRTFEHLLGTEDFMRIISSAARANPMTPRLSQARKGS